MDNPESSLHDRVDALEKAVAALQAELDARPQRRPSTAESEIRRIQERSQKVHAPSSEKSRRSPTLEIPDDPEVLLKWAGIGLVILAVAFLFKYAVDEGWLTPAIRVALGGLLGLILLSLGGYVYPKRVRFGQVLQGGGIAVFYITLFAAYQLLSVLDYQVSFVGMVAVTVLAFGLGIYQKGPPLIVLGLLGGLATPFLLYTGEGDIAGLMSYTCLILAATTIIYLTYGWRSVLYVTVIGGWLVFWIAQSQLPWDTTLQVGDRLAVQLAVGFGVLAFWCAPVVREAFRARKPEAVPDRTTESSTATALEWIFRNAVHQMIVATPLIAAALSSEIWRLSETNAGLLLAGAAAVYAVVALILASDAVERLRYSHVVMSGLLATLAIVLLIDGNGLLVALAVEAAALHVLAGRLDDKLIRSGGHSLFVILALWMWIRLVDHGGTATPLVNLSALSDLIVLALAIPAAFSLKNDKQQRIYLALAYMGALAWLYRELSLFDNGHAYVTAAWSVVGIALLIVGLRSQRDMLRGAGLATLVVVVGKLFVVDLAELDPLWRVGVFLLIGAGFLAVGYFLPQVWKPIVTTEEEGL